MTTQLLSRAALGMRAPKRVSYSITPEGLTAHYGGDSPWRGQDRSSPARFRDTTDHARCPSIWRAWQAFHMDDRGWYDIAYNSGVCPHGVRFEGRGDRVRSGANGTNDGNRRSYATVYIAGGSDPLTDEAKMAFLDEASRFGVKLRWDHSDWKSTACAGDPIRQWEAHGWPRPGATPTPAPRPTPTLPPPSGDFAMDVIDLRNVTSDPATFVRGRHVDNLQAIMVPILAWTGRPFGGLLNSIGAPDGVAGPATASALQECQEICLYFGKSIGASKADRVAGPSTWRSLIEF